jgi:hypothetical protein
MLREQVRADEARFQIGDQYAGKEELLKRTGRNDKRAGERSIVERSLHAAQEPATHGYGKESLLDRVELAKSSVSPSSGP